MVVAEAAALYQAFHIFFEVYNTSVYHLHFC